jgi:hypothetical protein
MKLSTLIGCSVLIAALAGGNCAPHHGEEEEEGHGEHLLERLQHSDHDSLRYAFSRFDQVDSAKLVRISGVAASTEAFLVPARLGEMKMYACSNCHKQPLATLQQGSATSGKKSHWDIELAHAPATTMQCATCHSPDDMNLLHSLTGSPIEFNHSYQLCGQCHATQFKDWQGGAHGKQVGGWAPPRVSQTCTGCHNPHKPAFEKRLPSRLNTEMLKVK